MSDGHVDRPWLKNYDGHVSPGLKYEEKCFADSFAEIVAKYPNKTALIYLGGARAHLTGGRYPLQPACPLFYKKRSGARRCRGTASAQYPGTLHWRTGCITTGLSPLLTAPEMEHQLKDSGTKIILTVDVLYSKIAEVADKAPFSTVVVSEIADFLPGVKRVLGKLLKKIPTGEVKPLPGKTVLRFTDIIKKCPSIQWR